MKNANLGNVDCKCAIRWIRFTRTVVHVYAFSYKATFNKPVT